MAGEPAVHCPTCGASWGSIAVYQCDGPRDAPHPRVRTVPGPPPVARERAVVVPGDHDAALGVVLGWQEANGLGAEWRIPAAAQLELVGMIAAAIADGRHQDEPGERQLVSVHTHVSRREWTRAPGDAQARALEYARVHLTSELVRRRLRPLEAWPTLERRLLCYCSPGPSTQEAFDQEDGDHPGFRRVEDEDQADLLCLYLETPAVTE